MLVLDALSERARSSRRVLALAFTVVGLMRAPAAIAQEKPYDCGPSHVSEVRETLRLRDPGAETSAGVRPGTLIMDRALIIEDFLRLREQGGAVDSELQRVVQKRLRDARDSGRTTREVCAVVRFMHGYYQRTRGPRAPADGKPAEAPVQQAAATQKSDTPDVAAAPRVKPARQPSAGAGVRRQELQRAVQTPRSKRASRPPPATAAAARRAPAADVASLDRAERRRATEADADARRSARVLIAEIETQLEVPRYLTYREVRIEAATLARDELKQRQAASLRASERVVNVLTELSLDPALRDAVQRSLGTEGRARIEAGILHTFKSVPDPQRERALRLWSELEALATSKRTK